MLSTVTQVVAMCEPLHHCYITDGSQLKKKSKIITSDKEILLSVELFVYFSVCLSVCLLENLTYN